MSLDKIKCAPDIQPRVSTDKAVVAEYAEHVKAKVKLPRVVVFFDGTTYWLAEGFHRLAAYILAGRKTIDCVVYKGSKDDAKWWALQSNQTHGLRRTNSDKAKAVKMAFEHPNGKDLSSRQIADLVGVSPAMVDKYRPKDEPTANGVQSRKRKGRDGRVIDTAKIGKGKKGNSKSSGGSAAKAGDKQNGKAQKAPTPQTGLDVEDPAVVGEDNDPVEVYRRMLENLPATLDELAEQSDKIAGKAMDSEAALQILAHMLTRLLVLQDAEAKLGKKKPRRARMKASDFEVD